MTEQGIGGEGAKRPSEKKIRAPEFARRLNQELDNNPLAPPLHFGRLGWLKTQLAERFDEKVSIATLGKWVNGEVQAEPRRVKMLAEILQISEAWLGLGIAADMTPREEKVRNATVSGAVNLIAGLVAMNGGHPAFPTEEDPRATKDHIDLYAIIRGAQYAFHVNLSLDEAWQSSTMNARFAVPNNYKGAMQIGVIPSADMDFDIVELTPEFLDEHGKRKGGVVEVVMRPADVAKYRIKNFRNRL